MSSLYPPFYPEVLLVEHHDEDLYWLQIKEGEEKGFHDSVAPRKYKIRDYQGQTPQFQAVVTQKNQVGEPHPPFSTVTIYSYELLEAVDTKILSYPDVRRLILLSPDRTHWIHLGDIVDSLTFILDHFSTLRSLVIPIELFGNGLSIPLALENSHPRLIQLELVPPAMKLRPSTRAILGLGFTFVLGLTKLQTRLQKLIIPASFLSPEILRFLGNMEHLQHLKIKSMGGNGGDHFVEMISEYGISSEHAFHALRTLDVGVEHIHPSKLHILRRRFPGIQYL
ncbi:hypothetical protein BDN70DRAFT_885231 [Pholiota conissans]|uniref:Uncharacterized protein n=1 Tax=Pholiota conissans TaxID=109636 RepID=A0A9P5YUD6_9AGAR|nr:hypothetical protein BDN70DRAFT_885231 [Pholiota conissans]